MGTASVIDHTRIKKVNHMNCPLIDDAHKAKRYKKQND